MAESEIFIVSAAREDEKPVSFHTVNETMFLRDPPTPGVQVFQSFRFAKTFRNAGTLNIPDQFIAASRGGQYALPRTGTKPLTMFALSNFMSWRSDQRERIHELARERHSPPVVPASRSSRSTETVFPA